MVGESEKEMQRERKKENVNTSIDCTLPKEQTKKKPNSGRMNVGGGAYEICMELDARKDHSAHHCTEYCGEDWSEDEGCAGWNGCEDILFD
jgi:hypothetical protein